LWVPLRITAPRKDVMPGAKDVIWLCLGCGYETRQPKTAGFVGHGCPNKGGRLVDLLQVEPNSDDDPAIVAARAKRGAP
jgi:hypothetical protein